MVVAAVLAVAATFGLAWGTPTVDVYSEAPRAPWGVGRAVAQWNQNGAVTLRLVSNPCTGCITIREGDIPDETPEINGVFAGWATYYWEDGRFTQCDITLDPQYGTRTTTMHEVGHCLGLDHNTGRHSVLNNENLSRVHRPSRFDLRRVALLHAGVSRNP